MATVGVRWACCQVLAVGEACGEALLSAESLFARKKLQCQLPPVRVEPSQSVLGYNVFSRHCHPAVGVGMSPGPKTRSIGQQAFAQ